MASVRKNYEKYEFYIEFSNPTPDTCLFYLDFLQHTDEMYKKMKHVWHLPVELKNNYIVISQATSLKTAGGFVNEPPLNYYAGFRFLDWGHGIQFASIAKPFIPDDYSTLAVRMHSNHSAIYFTTDFLLNSKRLITRRATESYEVLLKFLLLKEIFQKLYFNDLFNYTRKFLFHDEINDPTSYYSYCKKINEKFPLNNRIALFSPKEKICLSIKALIEEPTDEIAAYINYSMYLSCDTKHIDIAIKQFTNNGFKVQKVDAGNLIKISPGYSSFAKNQPGIVCSKNDPSIISIYFKTELDQYYFRQKFSFDHENVPNNNNINFKRKALRILDMNHTSNQLSLPTKKLGQ